MKSEPPRKKNFIGVETKFETYQIGSQTQINHPRIINHTNKNFKDIKLILLIINYKIFFINI